MAPEPLELNCGGLTSTTSLKGSDMKLTVDGITALQELPNAAVSFPAKDTHGRVHTIALSNEAQQDLVRRLLATSPAQSGTKPLRSLNLLATTVHVTSQNRIGLQLFLNPGTAIHVVLERTLAQILRNQLAEMEQITGTAQ